MSSDQNRADEIFDRALDFPAAERPAFLSGACGSDSSLRRRVETLLAAHEQQSGFLPDHDTVEEQGGPGGHRSVDAPTSQGTAGAVPSKVAPSTVASSTTEGPGTVIGRYKLLEKLGEGGFGSVWAAEQREPVKRRVALKIIKLGMDTRQVVARFEAERQALALMDHPNIAKVLDAGAVGVPLSSADFPVGSRAVQAEPGGAGWKAGVTGRPYFVMELVKGIPITKYCDQEQPGTKERLDLFIKVCHAIQHAHQKGIIHRDIKPSNILVTLHDGVPVPKVIDFGIAKATQQELTELTIYTQHHQFIGTPAYMSPEQAEMSGLDIDTRSDIYSLGVLLYEILTGTTPFDTKELMQSGLDEMRRIIREKEPVRPSTRLSQTLSVREVTHHSQSQNPNRKSQIDADLDWIVMKCLEKDRTRRYETANGLAADLRRYLDNEPVVARPPSAAYRFQKAWRRNKLAYSAGLVVAAALMAGLCVSTWMWVKTRTAEREQFRLREVAQNALANEEQQRRKANATADELRSTLYASEMNAAFGAFRAGSIERCRELLERQREPVTAELRGFEWRWLWKQTRPAELDVFSTGKWGVTSIDYSPDGRRLLTFGGELKVWDAATGELIQSTDHEFGYSASFVNNGTHIVSTDTFGNKVNLWDAETGQRLAEFAGHPQPVLSASVSKDERWLACASAWPYSETDAQLVVWDFKGRKQEATLQDPGSQWTFGLQFSPDDRLLAAGYGDGQIRLWDVALRQVVGRLTGHRGTVVNVGFTSDGKRLVSTGLDRTVRFWDVAERREVSLLGLHEKGAAKVRVSADDRWAVTTGFDHLVKVWSLTQPGWVRTLRGHQSRIFSAALLPDGTRIATADANGIVRTWNVPETPDDWLIEGPEARCFGFAPGSRLLLGLAADNHVDVWDVASRKRIVHTKGWNPLWIPGTQTILYNLEEDWFELDAMSGSERPLKRLAEETTRLGGRSISADGRWVALAHEGNHIHVFDRVSNSEVARLETGTGTGIEVDFSADGTLLASAGEASGEIQLWDTRTWQKSRRIEAHKDIIHSVRFSADGNLASSSRDGTTRLVNLATDKTWILNDDEGDPMCLAFSPDCRTLAVGTFDGALKLWDLSSRQQVIVFEAGSSIVRTVAFSPDGTALASTTMDRKVRVWQAPGWAEIQATAGIGTKSLATPVTASSAEGKR